MSRSDSSLPRRRGSSPAYPNKCNKCEAVWTDDRKACPYCIGTSTPGQVQHAPGPWSIEAQDSGMVMVRDLNEWLLVAIAINSKMDDANARLIAAAPELLKACRDALAFMDPDVETLRAEGRRNAALNVQIRCDQLRAAIVKAMDGKAGA